MQVQIGPAWLAVVGRFFAWLAFGGWGKLGRAPGKIVREVWWVLSQLGCKRPLPRYYDAQGMHFHGRGQFVVNASLPPSRPAAPPAPRAPKHVARHADGTVCPRSMSLPCREYQALLTAWHLAHEREQISVLDPPPPHPPPPQVVWEAIVPMGRCMAYWRAVEARSRG